MWEIKESRRETMKILVENPQANQKVSPRTYVLQKNFPATTLNILHQGVVLYLSPAEGDSQNKYLFSVKAPFIIGGGPLLLGSSYPFSVETHTESVISCYPISSKSLWATFREKNSLGILFLRSLYQEFYHLYNKLQAAHLFNQYLERVFTNLALSYYRIQPEVFERDLPSDSSFIDPILPQAKLLLQDFQERGGEIPDTITRAFLLSDKSALVKEEEVETPFSLPEDFPLYQKVISLKSPILTALLKEEPAILQIIAQKVARLQEQILQVIDILYLKSEESIENLFRSGYSWLQKYITHMELALQGQGSTDLRSLYEIALFLKESIEEVKERYRKTWNLLLKVPERELKILENFLNRYASIEKEEKREERKEEASISVEESMEDLRGVTLKIIQYVGASREDYDKYESLIKEFQSLKNPLDIDNKPRRVRKELNKLFYNVYWKGILKYVKERPKLPRFMQMFFHFSFFDERLLPDKDIRFLYHAKENVSVKYPIHLPTEWFCAIYEKKLYPSVNELGQDYFEILKQDHPRSGWKRISDVPADIDTGERRLKFEFQNMFQSGCRVTSGTPLSFLAILTEYQITQNIERAFVSKARLEKELDHLLSIDFSAFYREVLFRDPKANIQKEFVQVEVIPNFLLMPTAGTQFQFWQELEGKNRRSPGRMLCPIIATGDLFTMLLSAVGAFRWELTKTLLGPDWNNIAYPSITADYTDYVQFYKKNKELSPEAKEKLAQEFKRFRDDRSRFVHDYILWVKYESQGVMRLNKVARKILAKHIPFSKPIRESLKKLPAYAEVITKSENIRKKKARELEPRYKKYRQSLGKLPEELEHTYRFYNMEF